MVRLAILDCLLDFGVLRDPLVIGVPFIAAVCNDLKTTRELLQISEMFM